jgi:hypothetical protein
MRYCISVESICTDGIQVCGDTEVIGRFWGTITAVRSEDTDCRKVAGGIFLFSTLTSA